MDIVKNNCRAVESALAKGVTAIVADATKDAWAETRHQLQTQIYDTPESPNYKRTHNLINSARWQAKGASGTVTVGGKFDVGYAVYVHEGTARMPARPYMAAAAKAVAGTLYSRGPVTMELAMGAVK